MPGRLMKGSRIPWKGQWSKKFGDPCSKWRIFSWDFMSEDTCVKYDFTPKFLFSTLCNIIYSILTWLSFMDIKKHSKCCFNKNNFILIWAGNDRFNFQCWWNRTIQKYPCPMIHLYHSQPKNWACILLGMEILWDSLCSERSYHVRIHTNMLNLILHEYFLFNTASCSI